MHLVVTKVELKHNALPAFQEVFESSVPEFLGQASSWRGAEVSIDREANTALVVGYWEDADQMREVLASPEHAAVIQDLAVHFAGSPEVTFTEVTSRIGALSV